MTAPGSTVRAAPSRAWGAPRGPWTEPDLRALPGDHRYEIVDGCLHATPPPTAAHDRLVDEIVAALRGTAPPGWRPAAGIGVCLGESYLVPDGTVLRPGSPADPDWASAVDVALVVEIESPHTRRFDRSLKAIGYAEAGIESYWRVECTAHGPVAHLYAQPAGGHYRQHRSVQPGRCVTAELPYAVQVAPATWHRPT
jgi:Uma2 family endonuclease